MASETGWSPAPRQGVAQRPRGARSPGRSSPRRRRCPSCPCTATSTPACWRATSRSPTPRRCLVTPDHYLVRMLVSQGVPHDALGVPGADRPHRRRPTGGLAHVRHALVAVPHAAHTVPVGARAGRGVRPGREALGRVRRPPVRPAVRAAGAAGRSAARAVRPVRHRDPRDDQRRDRDARRPRRPGRPRVGRADRADVRPDALLHVDRPGWRADVALLEERSGIAIGGYRDLVRALEERRRTFVAAGARATDHGHLSADATPLTSRRGRADRVRGPARDRGCAGRAGVLRAHAVRDSADVRRGRARRAAAPGRAVRDHDRAVADCADPTSATTSRCPPSSSAACDRCSRRSATTPVSGSSCSRSTRTPTAALAPIAGVYPAVRLGAPWWFLDTPDGMAAVPRGGHGHRRVRQHHGLRRRHTRLLLDPRAARPRPPHRCRVPRPAGGGAPARPGRGHRHRRRSTSPTGSRARLCSSEYGKRFPAQCEGARVQRDATPRGTPPGPGGRPQPRRHADPLAEALVDGGLPRPHHLPHGSGRRAIRAMAARRDVLVAPAPSSPRARSTPRWPPAPPTSCRPGSAAPSSNAARSTGSSPCPVPSRPPRCRPRLARADHRESSSPAGTSGGAKAVAALAAPFGDVGFVPTGGIGPSNLGEYLALPSVRAVGGSWMVPRDLVRAGDFQAVRDLTAEAVSLVTHL